MEQEKKQNSRTEKKHVEAWQQSESKSKSKNNNNQHVQTIQCTHCAHWHRIWFLINFRPISSGSIWKLKALNRNAKDKNSDVWVCICCLPFFCSLLLFLFLLSIFIHCSSWTDKMLHTILSIQNNKAQLSASPFSYSLSPKCTLKSI